MQIKKQCKSLIKDILKTKIHILIGLTLILFSCTASEPSYTEEIIEGVRHIHNLKPLWGDEQRIRLEFVRKIGELNTSDERYQFHFPIDLDIDQDRNYYIVDSGNFRVVKYDREGNYILSFGNEGQGPGEFTTPWSIRVDKSGKIVIGDFIANKVHIFNSEGKFIDQKKFERSPRFVLPIDNGYVLTHVRGRLTPEDDPTKSPLIRIYNSERKIITEIGKHTKFEDTRIQSYGNDIQSSVDNEGNIYVTFLLQNRIEKYDKNGNLLLKISRKLPYEESSEYKTRFYKDENGETKEVHSRFVSVNNFANGGIWVDNKNRIWTGTLIRQINPGESSKDSAGDDPVMVFEVYNENWVLLGRIPHERFKITMPFKIIGDMLFLFDHRWESSIFQYRIVDN